MCCAQGTNSKSKRNVNMKKMFLPTTLYNLSFGNLGLLMTKLNQKYKFLRQMVFGDDTPYFVK